MRRHGITFSAFAGAFLLFLTGVVWVGEVQAATKTSAGTGNWGTAGTWSPSGVPANGDDVVIANTHVVTLNVNTNNLRTVTINAGGTLQGDDTSKTLSVTGNTGGNDFTNNGTLNFGPGFLATYTLANSNRLSGSGSWTFSVLNHSNRTLTFAAGSSMTLNISGAATPLPGSGTITSLSTVVWNFTGSTAQTLSTDAGTTYGIVRITNTAGVTLGVALTAARILGDLTVETGAILNNGGLAIAGAGTATFTVQDGARFKLAGTTSVMPTGFGTTTLGTTVANMSTVSFEGTGNQVVASGPTYGNLIAAGSSEKRPAAGTLAVAGDLTVNVGSTFNANSSDPTINVTGNVTIDGTYTASSNAARPLTITGNLSVSGTYSGSVAPLNVAGNFTRTGTFTSSTGLVTLNGTAATAQTVTGATTITNLAINNSGSPGGVTLASNITVGTLLTLTSGVVTTGSNTLITSANCPGSVSRAGGHVAGSLQLHVAAGASTCVHHVGGATTYRPISLTFLAGTTTGNLTGSVSQSAGDHGNIATADLDSTQDVNRFWTLTNSGVVPGAGGYSVTFTYIAGDIDAGSDTAQFEVASWDGVSWTTASPGTRTSTSTQATGLTSFSDFAVGQRKINNFLIGVPGATVSTCNAASVTFTARNSSNQVLTNYRGNVNLSTSTSHGDWTVGTANGTLTPGAADSGAASYVFASADKGIATFNLTNKHADDLTASITDTVTLVTSTSGTIQFRGNEFVISTPDALGTTPVAGRNHAMKVQMNQGASCATPVTTYDGSKTLKASISRDASDPGGAAPTIGIVSLTNAPTTANVTLTFSSGVANFNLSTTDVGKYVVNLTDDTRTFATGADITAASSTLTTRPFAIVVSGIAQGATINQGGNATSGTKFIAAADTFQATVGAYLWSSAADNSPADGAPDATATLAQITGAGTAPSYRWDTVLSAASPFTPATGSLGALSNGTQTGACPTGAPNCFASGVATPTNLSYNDVGSFTLSASATNFLNSGISLTAIVFDNSATPARNAVIGRFYPDHFTLTASSLTPACAGGGFTYMGHAGLGYTIGIDARGKGDLNTGCGTSGKSLCNYINNPVYNTGTVSLQAENSDSGTDVGSRLPAPTGAWAAGAYSFSTTTATFSRPGTPDGPFDSLQIGVAVADTDGAVLAARDMNAATTGACVPATTCTGQSIGTTSVRFGRLMIGNASGSPVLPLLVPIEAQYWNGKAFVTNTIDACTAIAASVASSNINMTNYTAPLTDSPKCLTAISGGGTLSAGRKTLQLAAPKSNGNVDLIVNLGASVSGSNTCLSAGASPTAETPANRAYLQSGSGFNQNPSARATFGVYRGSEEQIHRQENY